MVALQLCAGATTEEQKEYALRPVDAWKGLAKTGCTVIDGEDSQC